jgi:Tfp pilus assembly protein PilV
MKYSSLISDESGLSLIEVLVGSLVFMVGFSILIAFLGSATEKVSTEDLALASALAERTLLDSQTERLTDGQQDFIALSQGKRFRVKRTVSNNAVLTSIRVEIRREKAKRTLADMYYEFQYPEE